MAVSTAAATTAAAIASVPPTPAQELAAERAEARLAELLSLGASQANAATAVYGDTGTGKTRLICTAIEYAWEEFHRTSRVYTADLGGFGNKLLSLIRMGIAQVWNPTTHIEPFETFEFASMGYWPVTIADPFTGYADPHVALIPPRQKRWLVQCPNHHLVRTILDPRQLYQFQVACPVATCKALTTPQNWTVEEVTVRSPGFKHVGLWAFDSGTALQEGVMNDMSSRAGRDELGGEKGAINKIVSGTLTLGSNNRAHYGFAQNRMYQWMKNSRAIPGQVVPALWTFLERRATDDDKGGMPIYGPKISGQAKTTDVPSWVGNCLHVSLEKDERGIDVHRLWLETHMNPNEGNVPHLAKTRVDQPGMLPRFLQDPVDANGALIGEAFTVFSLAHFFRSLDGALEIITRKDAVTHADAPAFHPFTDDLVEEELDRKGLGAASSTSVQAGTPSGSVQAGTAAGGVAPRAPRSRPGARPAAAVAAPATPATPAVVGPQVATPGPHDAVTQVPVTMTPIAEALQASLDLAAAQQPAPSPQAEAPTAPIPASVSSATAQPPVDSGRESPAASSPVQQQPAPAPPAAQSALPLPPQQAATPASAGPTSAPVRPSRPRPGVRPPVTR